MRILIGGRRALLLRALKTLIQTRPDLEIVAMAKNKKELLRSFELTRPDLLLLDEDLDDEIVNAIVVPVQEFDPNLLIMILGQRSELKETYLEAGAVAYINMCYSPKSLLTALEEARLQRKYG